tara:strand:- start:44 stop:1993 length:1950 start_codon:yes stop_codon:yes gene_type:complete
MSNKSQINEGGASATLRSLVADAPNDKKKAVLQQYFEKVFTTSELQTKNPKLKLLDKYGEDNFFYVDKNNKMNVFNPPGLEMGDIAAGGREIASLVGGGAGGIIGSPGLVTTPIAVAMGSEMGGQLYEQVLNYITGNKVTRNLPENIIRSGENIGMEAVGGKLADNAVKSISKLYKKGFQTATDIKPGLRVDDFNQIAVQPTVATLTGSRGVAGIENVLEGNIFAADIIGASRNKLTKSLQNVSNKITNKLGDKAGSAEVAGNLIKETSKDFFIKIQTKKTNLYDAAFDAAGNVNIDLGNLKILKVKLESELAKAPNALKDIYAPSLNRINNLLKDANANGGILPLSVVRSARTEIGKIIGPATPGKIKIETTGDGKLNAIYKSLSEDIFSSVNAASPNAARLLKKADDYTKYVSKKTGGIEKTIAEIQSKGLDSTVYSYALQGGKDGGQRIRDVFKTLGRTERDTISSTVFSKLGFSKSNPESGWSATTFMNNWDKLDNGAKKILFGSPRFNEVAKEINSLVRITRVVDERRLLDNPSGTGKVNTALQSIRGLVLAGGLAFYNPLAGGIAASGAILGPRLAAKLMTSPRFIRWLKSTAQVSNQGANPLAIQFGKLATLPGKDGELAEAVNAFANNLKANMDSGGQVNF